MDKQNARLRINLSAREVEIEGSEEFVREYAAKLENALPLLAKAPEVGQVPKDEGAPVSKEQPKTSVTTVPEVFGEYLTLFPKDVSDIDKVLIAAYHVQTQAPESLFATAQANQLLKSQGIKVANASRAVKLQIAAKRAFPVSRGKYRVSQEGIDYIKSLMSR
jgi:hypothetical protein